MIKSANPILQTDVNLLRWQAPDVPAELAKRVICAHIREICFLRDIMGLKRQKFSWSLLTRHLYARQLAYEPQTGSLTYFSVAVRNGTKRSVLFIEVQHLRNMQAAAFAVPLYQDKQC